MGMISNPNVNKDSLVVSLDAANVRSFQGIARTNLARGVNYNQNNSNTSTYKYTQGTEVVNIPRIGLRTVKYVDHWNDYNGGSGNCCPSLFYYYDSVIPVSPSTTYTYSIIYKTTTGYTHPNFMYRYEYNSANTYLTEGGVHSTNNRIELGDGWYYAWGQFTTQSTTAHIITFLFYYQYATWDRVYVDRVSIGAGSTVPEPQHLTNYNSTNSGTLTDLSGNGYNATLHNGVTYSTDGGGSLVFDGSNDMGMISDGAALYWTPGGSVGRSTMTIDMWVKSSDTDGRFYSKPWNGSGQYNIWILPDSFYLFTGSSSNSISFGRNLSNNTWTNIVCWANGTQMGYYLNGNEHVGSQNHGLSGGVPSAGQSNIPTALMTLYPYGDGWGGTTGFSIAGNLGPTRIYNRVLTANEVLQNFNATRGRFGV
jgi:hypothetical protein